MDLERWIALAEELGFSHAGPLNVEALEFMPEVRTMCAADRCSMYGKSWTCPPGCGTLEEAAERAAHYRWGILLQSTGILEDDFDVETMQETERRQHERFMAFVERVREEYPDCLPMGTGACRICGTCTYPDAPCRFPGKAIPSMEAYGLWVSKVCEQSGMEYYHGKGTITFSACVLIA